MPFAHAQSLRYAFTNFAGMPGGRGSADGAGAAAGFDQPSGLAVDAAGNVLVVETARGTVRKVTPDGVVTTLAGSPGERGHADGRGKDARFEAPAGIVLDAAGIAYVGDAAGIRKVAEDGLVTTVPGTQSAAEMVGFSKRGIFALDGEGNFIFTDGPTLRRIAPAGGVSLVAGKPGIKALLDGDRDTARLFDVNGIVVDGAGNIYVTDSIWVRKIAPNGSISTLFKQPSLGRAFMRGLVVDRAGNLYLADGAATILQIRASGESSIFAGLTWDGSQARDRAGLDGPRREVLFYFPQTLALDKQGNLFVTDYSTVRRIGADGIVKTLAGRGSSAGSVDGTGAAARFSNPFAVAVDAAGTLYVADGNNTIRKITPDGQVTTLAGDAHPVDEDGLPLSNSGFVDGKGAAARFRFCPWACGAAIAADNAGNVFVADHSNSAIRKITPDGVVTTLAGPYGEFGSPGYADGQGGLARFNLPSGIAVDKSGNLYVADRGNSVIRRVTPDGMVTTLAGTVSVSGGVAEAQRGSVDGVGAEARFIWPSAIAIDQLDNLWVLDGNAVRRITAAGVVTTEVKPEAFEAAGIFGSNGIAVDNAGDLYLTGGGENVVFRFSADRQATVIAGKDDLAGWEDGVGTSARFNSPTGVAVDRLDNLYVADSGNNRITKGTPIWVPESRFSRLSISGGTLTAQLSGLVAGWAIILESSTNLRDWSPIQTNAATGAAVSFSYPISSAPGAEYLRVTTK